MWPAPAPAKFEYSSLIGQGQKHRSLMLVTSHVRLAFCTLPTIRLQKVEDLQNQLFIQNKYVRFLLFDSSKLPFCKKFCSKPS